MSENVNFHPSSAQLREFGQGTQSTGMTVAVAAHLELCTSCRHLAAEVEKELAAQWAADNSVPDTERFDHMLEDITNAPQLTEYASQSSVLPAVHMQEYSVNLPRVLAKAAGDCLLWKKLAGGINQARLAIDKDTQCDFMYMKPGSQAPRHTHQGTEITLVLEGTFHDELGTYQPGDFIVRRQDQTHTPESDDGCLCFTVLDSPLTFTTGIARLLNPFQKLLFNR
ncbi:MAG: hypothetical protein RLZZ385_2464 [Pseudomonadota bacterium]|jgi:putative transcriptional regulator